MNKCQQNEPVDEWSKMDCDKYGIRYQNEGYTSFLSLPCEEKHNLF